MAVSFLTRLAALSLFAPTILVAGCTSTSQQQVEEFEYAVPMDPMSPWPKFRRNAMQNGRSPVKPIDTGADVWEFQTGKGIFSTPVIDAESNVYIGSADRVFYSLDRNGIERWQYLTGEVVDSSALLDDRGVVYFGSGDGHVYALDRDSSEEVWDQPFEADDPSVTGALINWFEANVAMMLDGSLIVPNDNFCTYSIDRQEGTADWCFVTLDQTWSLPALNPETETLFIGNNWFFQRNVFGLDPNDLDPGTGAPAELWSFGTLGTVAASPLLTSTEPSGLVVVGAYDGFAYALRQDTGQLIWSFGARDHIYASPGQMEDGAIIQPAGDGTIYALDPADGSVTWAFDTREPIRSSPAIDGDGNIYVGSGEGRLFVLNPDGSLRWSILLLEGQRNDLNASPALGKEFVAVAGEDGRIFGVPYDYCLRDRLSDERCTLGPGEGIADDGVFIVYTTHFGGLELETPGTITANQPLTFSLFVREAGDTKLALIDSENVEVTTTGSTETRIDVSGDRRFITIIPTSPWVGAAGGTLEVRITGDYLVDLDRAGLVFSGGTIGGSFDQSFNFSIEGRSETAFPFAVPDAPGDDSGIMELYRLAAPLPTVLPSYNQIGFDSIHYLIGVVEGEGDNIVTWGIGGMLDEEGNTVVNPASRVRFPLVARWDDGALTMFNEEGFTIEFNGFPLPFRFFGVATKLDSRGNALHSPYLNAKTICGEIDIYGVFLQRLGLCNADTDLMEAVGGAEFRPHEGGTQAAPEGVGTVEFSMNAGQVVATFTDSTLQREAHNFGILLLDASDGVPVGLNYTVNTAHTPETAGTIETVTLDVTGVELPGSLRVYLMVDAYPAAVQTLN
ncbi:MAG: PQQ-binding-like beta-propeller repeat protein [Myxococcales bacterium]|nr:PQQ-binding-like beta-propeller repeat protein [Myxococcales bacterium]MDH3483248.1 PQQ-binding-like beta-propeller repeat protein [Myxococcales bacterium]